MIIKFKIFEEVRFEDVMESDSIYINSFKKEFFDSSNDFIKYMTLRIDNVKMRFNFNYNHTENHNLKRRINDRTSLKSIDEFNSILKKSITELFLEKIDFINGDGSYSLYFKEYDFSIILNINQNTREIFIKTVSMGLDSINVKNIIEINCVL